MLASSTTNYPAVECLRHVARFSPRFLTRSGAHGLATTCLFAKCPVVFPLAFANIPLTCFPARPPAAATAAAIMGYARPRRAT